MQTKSAKAKGRRLQDAVVSDVQRVFGIPDHLIRARIMGEPGEDIVVVRPGFPYAIECANQESLNIWRKLQQAETNAGGRVPLLVFKRNRSTTYVALRWQDFLALTHPEEVVDAVRNDCERSAMAYYDGSPRSGD